MKPAPHCLAGVLLSLVVSAWDAVCAADTPRSCEIATKTETIDGGTIAYDVAGQGPVILLLHGLFATKEQWQGLPDRAFDTRRSALHERRPAPR